MYDTSNINCVLLVLSVLVTIETTQFYKALFQVKTVNLNVVMQTVVSTNHNLCQCVHIAWKFNEFLVNGLHSN